MGYAPLTSPGPARSPHCQEVTWKVVADNKELWAQVLTQVLKWIFAWHLVKKGFYPALRHERPANCNTKRWLASFGQSLDSLREHQSTAEKRGYISFHGHTSGRPPIPPALPTNGDHKYIRPSLCNLWSCGFLLIWSFHRE